MTSQASQNDDVDPDSKDLTDRFIRASRKEAVQRTKAQRKAQKKAEMMELVKRAEPRKKKVKLNRLSSISGTGGGGALTGKSERECFLCGKTGHNKENCQSRKKRRIGDDRDPSLATRRKVSIEGV